MPRNTERKGAAYRYVVGFGWQYWDWTILNWCSSMHKYQPQSYKPHDGETFPPIVRFEDTWAEPVERCLEEEWPQGED